MRSWEAFLCTASPNRHATPPLVRLAATHVVDVVGKGEGRVSYSDRRGSPGFEQWHGSRATSFQVLAGFNGKGGGSVPSCDLSGDVEIDVNKQKRNCALGTNRPLMP